MIESICRRAFFQFELPIHYCPPLPVDAGSGRRPVGRTEASGRRPVGRVDGDIGKWQPKHLAPPLVELEDVVPFADVYWGWNEDGLLIAFDVPGRFGTPRCDPARWWKGDGVRICVDTRDARDIKRATRFCHFFYALPTGGGPRRDQPVVGTHRMSRAKEYSPNIDPSQIAVAARVERTRYGLELAIPAACLHGWDPSEHPRIGVFYKIKDTCHGGQHLSVDDELGWNVDPSTWATGVLVR